MTNEIETRPGTKSINGCPKCGTEGHYLFMRPTDPRYRCNYVYHKYVCHTHKLKSTGGAGLHWSACQHLSDAELEQQYKLLDSYAEVEWVYYYPQIVKAVLVVRFTETTLYGFDSQHAPYLLASKYYEGESMQTPEPHPAIVALAEGLLLAAVDPMVEFLNPDDETLYFAERFSSAVRRSTIIVDRDEAFSSLQVPLVPVPLTRVGERTELDDFLSAEDIRADLNRPRNADLEPLGTRNIDGQLVPRAK